MTTSMTTDTTIPRSAAPCPPWCDRDHEDDLNDDFRFHRWCLATWEHEGRRISVGLEVLGKGDPRAEHREPPTICVTSNKDDAWDDLTPEQARELGPFLAEKLEQAAALIEEGQL